MAKTPRLDPYHRLMCRLYEAFFLLRIFGQVRGPHTTITLDSSTELGTRRRFLSNLAFLCDYAKGGPTTTAIAVEDCVDSNLLWVSSNEGTRQNVVSFLKKLVHCIKEFHLLPRDGRAEAKNQLLQMSINFSNQRIRKQARGLANVAARCRAWVEENKIKQGGKLKHAGLSKSLHRLIFQFIELDIWLQQFELPKDPDLVAVCKAAWKIRRAPEINLLLQLGSDHASEETGIPSATKSIFKKTRHLIGRLAAYTRACEELVEDGGRLGALLDVFEVAAVERPTSVTQPQADGHTNLDGVLKRLFGSNNSNLPRFSEYLRNLESQTSLECSLVDYFNAKGVVPCVHAELQMLHHFHDNNRAFFQNDSYIATSKPACFYCKLYFRHHPAGVAELASHEKVPRHWAPIHLEQGRLDPLWIMQRDVLQKFIKDIGKEIEQELTQRMITIPYHADTLTALTPGNRSLHQHGLLGSRSEGFDGHDTDSDSDGGSKLY